MFIATMALVACGFQDEIPEGDITGTVVVPRAAATRTVVAYKGVDESGAAVLETREETDPRLIGPVFLGAYSGIDTTSFAYPHPSMGPIYSANQAGDTFPYGGMSVGRFDFACYASLACSVQTGRFEDYADIIDYFTNSMGRPIQDYDGNHVGDASVFQQMCFEYYYATTDDEMSFIGDLDFEENSDGDFEASFVMNHTLRVDNEVIWGWMDAPSIATVATSTNPQFGTCDANTGRQVQRYNTTFYEGRSPYDLLNSPSSYIAEGDWISSGDTTITWGEDGLPTEEPRVVLDFAYGGQE